MEGNMNIKWKLGLGFRSEGLGFRQHYAHPWTIQAGHGGPFCSLVQSPEYIPEQEPSFIVQIVKIGCSSREVRPAQCGVHVVKLVD